VRVIVASVTGLFGICCCRGVHYKMLINAAILGYRKIKLQYSLKQAGKLGGIIATIQID